MHPGHLTLQAYVLVDMVLAIRPTALLLLMEPHRHAAVDFIQTMQMLPATHPTLAMEILHAAEEPTRHGII